MSRIVWISLCLILLFSISSLSSDLYQTQAIGTINWKEECDVEILNLRTISDSIFKSPQVDTLKRAGVPCTITIKIFLNPKAEYIDHEFIEGCHPIAMKVLERYIKNLKFKAEDEKEIQKGCEVKIDLFWKIQ